MTKNIFAPIICGSIVLLSACASTTAQKPAPQINEKSSVSAPMGVASHKDIAANPNSEMARVFVVRDFITPILLKTNIKIDGEKIGRLKNGQYLETYVAPGDHVLAVSFSKLSMARGTKYNISVAAGETYAWELESSIGMAVAGIQNIRLTQFDPQQKTFQNL